MKKVTLIFTLIVTILLLTSTCIFANNNIENDTMKSTDEIRNIVGGTENVIEDAVKTGTNDIRTGINTVENGANNITNNATNGTNNGTTNSGNYTATRTATSTDAGIGTNADVMNNAWTWIIVAIIAIVIIAVIWYYSTRSNNRD